MNLNVVLYQPEIPANTGNIARTCLATDTTLHLIHPLGFSTDDKRVRRAGLDYWKNVDIREYESIDALYEKYPDGVYYYVENFGTKHLTDCDYSCLQDNLFFVFGKETKGIPRELLIGKEDQCLRIHMNDKVRSLNLSNSAAIVIYEALRQRNFIGLT